MSILGKWDRYPKIEIEKGQKSSQELTYTFTKKQLQRLLFRAWWRGAVCAETRIDKSKGREAEMRVHTFAFVEWFQKWLKYGEHSKWL